MTEQIQGCRGGLEGEPGADLGSREGGRQFRLQSGQWRFGCVLCQLWGDVFETDSDGKLLLYCPMFDKRAVHKTQEVVERVTKGASR